MKSIIFDENERSNEPEKSSYPLANITDTNQNLYWQAHNDSKNSSQQLTMGTSENRVAAKMAPQAAPDDITQP